MRPEFFCPVNAVVIGDCWAIGTAINAYDLMWTIMAAIGAYDR